MHDEQDLSDENSDEFLVSKTQIKREALDITAFGKKLAEQPERILSKLPLSDELLAAIEQAKRIKQNSAAKRHFKFLGKLLREYENIEQLREQFELLLVPHHQQVKQFHRCEQWRDRLLSGSQSDIEALISEAPGGDRQKMRQLVRQAKKEEKEGKPPKFKRQLFKYIQEVLSAE